MLFTIVCNKLECFSCLIFIDMTRSLFKSGSPERCFTFINYSHENFVKLELTEPVPNKTFFAFVGNKLESVVMPVSNDLVHAMELHFMHVCVL